jgi:single-stranded-DNA-specific exonuclease
MHLMQAQISLRSPKTTAGFSSQVHPVLQRILAARGVAQDAELELALADLLPPSLLRNIDAAVLLLQEALHQQQRLLILADFDADGATSCALALSCLRSMGFLHVDYLVPNRFEYGYGLTPEIVEVARERNPDLIITVDNGIASHAGIARANALGMRVLVTDHHLPADTLPAAACIVNPNQPDCGFPSKALAGVGVVFYLMTALRTALREAQWFAQQNIPEPRLITFLDLVALGTVADVVPLDSNNRRLVKHGMQLIRSGRARPGIRALLEVAGRNGASIVANDLGFAVGPRLNAAGRLTDMSLGIECLLCDDEQQALRMARQLDSLNKERRLIEQDMQADALALLDSMSLQEQERLGVCLHDSAWHQGVIGILASRIKDRLHRPVIVFADAGNDSEGTELIKGSARSIAGVHIRDILDAVATHNPQLLSKFGGHAMAAGLTLRKQDFSAFCTAFELELQRQTDPELFTRSLLHDGELPADCLSLEFAQLLRTVTPWGQHFPEPLFTGVFDVMSSRVLADSHLKLVLQVPGSTQLIDAIAFNVEQVLLQASLQRVQLLYKLDVNEYRGQSSPQLIIERLEEIRA